MSASVKPSRLALFPPCASFELRLQHLWDSKLKLSLCVHCSRQFGHRVKGVSMSSFKPDEIKALQEGGNGVSLTAEY